MGHIFQKVKIENPENREFVFEEALVDTGATDTVIPKEIAKKLKLKTLGKLKAETAKGKMLCKESVCKIYINKRKKVVPVIISEYLSRVLIGTTTLETMGLRVDPIKKKLIKTNILLY